MNNTINPFNITNAKDLTDKQIEKFWVDIGGENGYSGIIKPASSMPIIILGGKGSGKTHLMRYCSYGLQKLRHENLIEGIRSEGYVGIYLRCSGLNANRFHGKNQSLETWGSVFSYYLELWLSQLLLEIVIDIMKFLPNKLQVEKDICKSILNLFDLKVVANSTDRLVNIFRLLEKLRREVDLGVNNCSITNKLEGFRIVITSGKLIFGIPKILSQYISEISGTQYLYIIDEVENLIEPQQKYIQTLLREKEIPSSFRLGSRLYGLRTYETYSAGEENKEGSEFEKFIIDAHFRKYENEYDKFIKNLCMKRLEQAGFIPSENINIEDFSEFLSKVFITSSREENYRNLYKKQRRKDKELPYFGKLKRKLTNRRVRNIPDILRFLEVADNPLLERVNIFLFYRDWKSSKGQNLLEAAEKIKSEAGIFLSDTEARVRQRIILEKFKTDIEDQLILECQGKLQYSGIKSFTLMSTGIPRILLKILKHVYKISSFNGEKPFLGGQISVESQTKGVMEAAEWFFDDARIKGNEGRLVKDAVSRLAHFLREIRFSDLPPECSLSSFTLDFSSIPQETAHMIDLAEKCSYIIRIGDRHDKNSKRIDPIYQINGILAPKWNLPLSKRGELSLTKDEAGVIFDDKYSAQFDEILRLRLLEYNAPFNYSKNGPQESTFDFA